jgi:integrase
MRLTTTTTKALTLPDGVKDRTFWDDDLGGFGLRLRAGGSRAWIVQYDIGGKTRLVTLGSTALLDIGAARARAKDLLAQIRLGGDPAADKRARQAQAAETFGAYLPRYLTAKQSEWRPASYRQVARRLETLAKPLHALPITSIDRRAISKLIGDIAEQCGPTVALNTSGTLSGYFAWLMGEGLLEANPVLGSNKPAPRPARDRVPTDAELKAAWTALPDGDTYGDLVKLTILNCSRRAEMGGLGWDEVDLDKAEIDISAERMKGGRPHLIPLSTAALTILKRRPRNGDLVFGTGPNGFTSWSSARRALDKALGGERPDWTLHDWRRMASTVMHEKLGVQPHIVERCLAHVGHQSGIAGIYNRSEYAREKRAALQKWADYVHSVVTGEQLVAKIVPLMA